MSIVHVFFPQSKNDKCYKLSHHHLPIFSHFYINILSSINWVFLQVSFFFLWHCADYLTCSKAVSPFKFQRISGGPFWQWLSSVLKNHISDGHYHYYCITVHCLNISTFSAPTTAQYLPRSWRLGERALSAGGLTMGISLIRVSNECGAVGICEHSSPQRKNRSQKKIPVQTLQLFSESHFSLHLPHRDCLQHLSPNN